VAASPARPSFKQFVIVICWQWCLWNKASVRLIESQWHDSPICLTNTSASFYLKQDCDLLSCSLYVPLPEQPHTNDKNSTSTVNNQLLSLQGHDSVQIPPSPP
jgi:hypothetical protein